MNLREPKKAGGQDRRRQPSENAAQQTETTTEEVFEEELGTATGSRLNAIGSSLVRHGWKWIVTRCIWVVLLMCGIYRFLTFVPQPLDSPGTLRPHLYSLFAAFLNHYPTRDQAQASWSTLCFWLLLLPTMLVLLNYFTVSKPRGRVLRTFCSATLLFISIGLALVACRFPILLLGQLNPDETHFLAAADKLFTDPIFFHSVDCGTSGPFNVLPLMFPALAGFSPDYASGRLMGLLLILTAVYIVYRTFCLIVDDRHARIAILPVAGAFAVLKTPDLLHYSSETVSLFLVSLATFFCVRAFTRPAQYMGTLFSLGMLTGAAFFAKMQAVPVVMAAAVLAAFSLYRTVSGAGWRLPAIAFLAGLAPLPVINAALCLSNGIWHDFWMSYVVANYVYTGTPPQDQLWHFIEFLMSVQEIRLFIVTLLAILIVHNYNNTLREQPDNVSLYLRLSMIAGIAALAADYALRTFTVSNTSMYAGLLCIFAFVTSLGLMWQKESSGARPMRWFGLAIAVILAASLFAVYAPHRFFPHYLLLLVIPVNMAVSWPTLTRFREARSPGEGMARAQASPGSSFVLLFITLIVTCLAFLQEWPGFIGFTDVPSEVRRADGDFIRSITRSSDRITVWGWNTHPYLDSGRIVATRDLSSENLFNGDPAVRKFYQDRFVRDIKQTPPQLFVDAAGPASFPGNGGIFQDRKTGGFELIPEIKRLIGSDYVDVADGYGERFYMRRDLLSGGSSTFKKCDGGAIRCFDGTAGPSPAELPPIRMPDHAIIDVVFIADRKPDPYATVFSNDPDAKDHAGFHFHHIADDQYELAIGMGNDYARSKYFLLPHKMPVALSFEFNGNRITIVQNGVKRDEMQLPASMPQSDIPINIGSWVARQRVFNGKVQFFQIRELPTSNRENRS